MPIPILSNGLLADLVSSLNGHVKIEDLNVEHRKLTLQKKTLLHRLIPEALKRTVGTMGMDVIKEYIGRVLSDWNAMIIQRQEFLEQLCDQFDRNRVFAVMPFHLLLRTTRYDCHICRFWRRSNVGRSWI